MKITGVVAAFALLASLNVYAGSHSKKQDCEDYAPLFQNYACGGWWAETQSLFNGDSGSGHKACKCKKSENEAPLFQNQPCRGWMMHTRSLFNG